MWAAAIVDLAKKVKHTKMGEIIDEAITSPGLVGVKLKQELLDIAFPATVQSGGVYDLRATAQNDDRPIKYDVITVSIGALPLHVCVQMHHGRLTDLSEGHTLHRRWQ